MTTILNRFIGRPLLLLLAISVVPMAACDDGTDPFADPEFTVMSRNIYLGADIFQLAQAQNQQELVVVAGQLFNHVHATDFRVRAELLADEIDAEGPALIGLQEVALYRLQAESDFQTFPIPNADEVVYDFVDLLLEALDDRGLDYRIAARVQNADAELPALLDASNQEELSDVRLTIYDVILVRSGVSTSNARTGNYEAAALLPAGGFEVPFPRGWTAVDARFGGERVTFVNTHIEGIGTAHEPQILELLDVVNDIDGRVIVVGDLNAQADLSVNQGYRHMVIDGPFDDAFAEAGTGAGFTCCFAADLITDTRQLDERIDYVLYKGDLQPLSVDVVGEEEADRDAATGLRPSDHAGVVATFEVR